MPLSAAVVVGNPRARSRTLDAATRVAHGLAGGAPALVVDLAEIDSELLGWGTPVVQELVAQVAACDLVVVASPTYKAAYTGLLKLFLDKFAGGSGLADVVVAPVMLGGSLAHSLAPELTLKPVLAELGATTALPGLYLLDSTYAQSGDIERYVARWAPVVQVLADRVTERRRRRRTSSTAAPPTGCERRRGPPVRRPGGPSRRPPTRC